MKQQSIRKSKLRDIPQCEKKTTYSRRVNLLKQVDDYGVTMDLCSRHKSYLQDGEVLVSSNLKKFAVRALLGEDEDTKLIVNENLDYVRKQGRAGIYSYGIEISINAAKHFTGTGDGRFLFGFYFGQVFALSSFRDSFSFNPAQWRRARQIRNSMVLKRLYGKREHPDTGDDLVDLCRCGHEWFMHDYGPPRGNCFTCLCPRYEYEQKLRKSEARDLQLLISRELENSG